MDESSRLTYSKGFDDNTFSSPNTKTFEFEGKNSMGIRPYDNKRIFGSPDL